MRPTERVLQLVLTLLAAWLVQVAVLQLGNDLHRNGRWESRKIGLSHGILGSVSYVTTRTALFRNRIDLGVWHGYHEVVTREGFDWDTIEARIQLGSAGWVLLEFGDPEQAMAGFRFSRSDGLPSGCLSVDPEGGFRDRQDLALQPDDAWHTIRLERAAEGFVVRLDDEELVRCRTPSLEGPHRIGLRGSADDKVRADDLRVEAAGRVLFEEDFANRRHAPAIFVAALGAVLLLQLGLVAVFRRGDSAPRAGVVRIFASALLLVIVGLAWAVDWIVLWRLHPDDPAFHDYPNRIEYELEIVPRLEREIPPGPAPVGVRRVVFLGSSQTWGSGARAPDETWVRRTIARLDACAGAALRVEGINTGIPAFTAARIRPLWETRWSGWQPDWVVIDLANNDRDPAQLAAELDAIARFNEERGIRTALVLEPNTIENRRSLGKLEARHAAMRAVGERHGIPVLDMHGRLVARRDEGFLWWDRVHLTSFGHRLFAEELTPVLGSWLGVPCEPPPKSGP